MNEYFQLDFRSNTQVISGTPEDTFSLRRETMPGLVLAASQFWEDYGGCRCSLWHWCNGALVEDPVLGMTVAEFVEKFGKGMTRIVKCAEAAREELAAEVGK